MESKLIKLPVYQLYVFTNFITEDVFQYWVMPTNYPEVITGKVEYYFWTQTLL